MYQLDQLQAFITVCQCGSFSAAARKLGKAQSAISQSIANLEIELNQTLFIRSKNSAHLSEQGKALLPFAEHLWQEAQFFAQKVQSLAEKEEHQLKIAIEETLLDETMLNIFHRVRQKFPHTNVIMDIASSDDIEQKITTAEIDFGIAYQRQAAVTALNTLTIGKERFTAVVAPQHPLATKKHIRLEQLQQHCQLIHQEQQFLQYSPHYWQCNSYYALHMFVEAGIGWAILPERVASDRFLGQLTQLSLDFSLNLPHYPILLFIAHHHFIGQVSQYFIEQLSTLVSV